MDEEYIDIIFSSQTSLSDKFDAVKQLGSDEMMEQVLLDASSAEIRSYALSKVDNQDVLIKVVQEDPNSTLRRFAIDKLSTVHYEVFETVAFNDPDPLVREQAVIKMPPFYYEQYAKVLMNDPDSRVRNRASQKIRMDKLTQEQLHQLAINAVDPYIRRASTYSISGEATLQEIAILGDDIQIIQHCIEQINSKNSLMTILRSTEFVSTKLEVLNYLRDRDMIQEFIEVEENEIVIKAAERRLRSL